MGLFDNSEEHIESKGAISNNLDSIKTHKEEISNLMYIVIGAVGLMLLLKVIQIYKKKRYTRNNIELA